MSDISITTDEDRITVEAKTEQGTDWMLENLGHQCWTHNATVVLDMRVAEFVVEHARYDGLTVEIQT